MKFKNFFVAAALSVAALCGSGSIAYAAEQPTAAAVPTNATVEVYGTPNLNPDGSMPGGYSLGSGWIIHNPYDSTDTALYVITNNHVIADDAFIKIRLCDGTSRVLDAQYVDASKTYDVAILKIVNAPAGLKTVTMGDSDKLHAGDKLVAVGTPEGLVCSTSQGVVSNPHQLQAESGEAIVPPTGVIQTDTAINHGNSGGPMFAYQNGKWVVVGMNTFGRPPLVTDQNGQPIAATDGNMGLNFALPVNMVKHVLDDYFHTGKITIADAGVSFLPFNRDAEYLAAQGWPADMVAHGYTPTIVIPSSQMGLYSGLNPGDVLISINGYTVSGPSQARYALAYTPYDQNAATFKVLRNGQVVTVQVGVVHNDVSSQRVAPGAYDGNFGAALAPVFDQGRLDSTPAERAVANLPLRLVNLLPLQGAALVEQVAPLSPAHKAGIGTNMVIFAAADLDKVTATGQANGGKMVSFQDAGKLIAYINDIAAHGGRVAVQMASVDLLKSFAAALVAPGQNPNQVLLRFQVLLQVVVVHPAPSAADAG